MNAATQRAALLAAVCADPADDGVRLAYADFLEENGEGERAEFVRIQLALAAWPCECDTSEERVYHDECRCKERAALRRRERELLEAHRGEWFRLLCRRPGSGKKEPLRWWPVASNEEERRDRGAGCPILSAAIEVTPRRGFLDSLTCTLADWLAHGPALVLAAPLTSVRLSDREPACYALTGQPHWTSDASYFASANSTCLLPAEVYGLLRGGIAAGSTRDYDTADLAWADASRALLAWARHPAPGRD